jgi:hypothetical protein
MKIRISLLGSGGELDRQEIEANEKATSTDVSDSIHDAIKAWVLGPGDVIQIAEVEGE